MAFGQEGCTRHETTGSTRRNWLAVLSLAALRRGARVLYGPVRSRLTVPLLCSSKTMILGLVFIERTLAGKLGGLIATPGQFFRLIKILGSAH